MDRNRISHCIGNKAWLIFHDSDQADAAAQHIDQVANYRESEGGEWGSTMSACISTTACIVCVERKMGTWNIFRPREAKFLIDEPLEILDNVDKGIVTFSSNPNWCPFCDSGYHARRYCPVLSRCLHINNGRSYECYRCLAINHHHVGQCRFPEVRGAAAMRAMRERQQYNIHV